MKNFREILELDVKELSEVLENKSKNIFLIGLE